MKKIAWNEPAQPAIRDDYFSSLIGPEMDTDKAADKNAYITDSLNKVEYCPLKKPFKVYVDSVRYHESSMMPYIEGKMEGTLYNRYDVNDSIVVKDAIFGIH